METNSEVISVDLNCTEKENNIMKFTNLFKAKKILAVCIICTVWLSASLTSCVSSRDYQSIKRENNIIREAWCEDNHLWNIVRKNVTERQWTTIIKEYRAGILINKSGCAFGR